MAFKDQIKEEAGTPDAVGFLVKLFRAIHAAFKGKK